MGADAPRATRISLRAKGKTLRLYSSSRRRLDDVGHAVIPPKS